MSHATTPRFGEAAREAPALRGARDRDLWLDALRRDYGRVHARDEATESTEERHESA